MKTHASAIHVDVLTADEVAEILRVDRKTVYDGAGRGEIPCRRLGKRLLFSRQAIMLWLEGKAAS
jgi:excisionase family DNA binding protein